jgi:hypothetical protein
MLTEKINTYADFMQTLDTHHHSDEHQHPHELHEHDPTCHLFEFFRNQLLLEMNDCLTELAYKDPLYFTDKYLFQNYIFNNMINVEFWSSHMRLLMAPILEFCEKGLSKKTHKMLCDWFDLAGNSNYVYKKDNDWRKAKLYFHRLFIPVFVKWQKDAAGSKKEIDDFNDILKNEKLNYYPGQNYDYFNELLIFNVIEKKRKVLFDLIDYLKKIKPQVPVVEQEAKCS